MKAVVGSVNGGMVCVWVCDSSVVVWWLEYLMITDEVPEFLVLCCDGGIMWKVKCFCG